MEVYHKSLEEKMNAIDEKAEAIKKLQANSDSPIFVELIGTPKSGKTTLKNNLTNLLKKKGIDFLARRETAEYNPMEKTAEGYNLWMILELLKNVDEDLSKKQGQIIIYDRGLFDRIPWMQYDIQTSMMTKEDLDIILKMYQESIIRKYKPISKLFITSPELSIKRKGKEGTFVNKRTIGVYNKLLKQQASLISSKSSYSDITFTDEYEGDIKNFTVDSILSILQEVEREFEERRNKKELPKQENENSSKAFHPKALADRIQEK